MFIYLVSRTDSTGYDEQIETIVVALDETDAREFASLGAGDEGKDRWFVPSTVVTRLGVADAGVGMGTWCRDFHAA